jgi:hypothetical protein
MVEHEQTAWRPVHDGRRPRREFLATVGLSPILVAFAGGPRGWASGAETQRQARLFYTSHGKTALKNADGTGLKYFNFDKPGHASWQPGGTSPDGRLDPLSSTPAGIKGSLGIPAASPGCGPLQPRLQARTRAGRHRDLQTRRALGRTRSDRSLAMSRCLLIRRDGP